MTTLFQTALEERAKTMLTETHERVGAVRKVLDDYELGEGLAVEHRLTNLVLSALGSAQTPQPVENEYRSALISELRSFLAFLGEETATASVATTVAPTASEIGAWSSDLAALSRAVTTEAWSQEFLTAWIQALTAEAREMLSRLPANSEHMGVLDAAFSTLGNLRKQAGITTFVHGLSKSAVGDWSSLSKSARAQMTGMAAAKTASRKQKTEQPKLSAVLTWPELPKLRALIEKKGPLLMVGGRQVRDKIELVQKRFGLAPEWREVEDAPRLFESTVAKIKGGSTAAVLLVEGFSPHKVTDAVVEACKETSTPFALVGTGGIGAIGQAIHTIEERLP